VDEDDPEQARENLVVQLKARKLHAKSAKRIIPLRARFEAPCFGLDAKRFAQLATEVDAVFHTHAEINHIVPYDDLKADNVSSTLDVIRLASTHHYKPVHYVSSLTVFTGSKNLRTEVREDDPLDVPENLAGGYDATRWVSEKCLRLAEQRGMPVTIYRPGLMLGDSKQFISTPDDFIWRLILTCVELGHAPEGEYNLAMTPVDFASQSILWLSQHSTSAGQTYHCVNPQTHTLKDILEQFKVAGYPMTFISWPEWEALLQKQSAVKSTSLLVPYFMFLGSFSWKDLADQNNIASLDSSRFRNALDGSGITCAGMDQELVEAYIQDLLNQKLLNKPGWDAEA